jgi:hypothetical protein
MYGKSYSGIPLTGDLMAYAQLALAEKNYIDMRLK